MKTIIYYLQYFFFRAASFLINLIPFRLALQIANKLGRLILKTNQRRMKMTMDHLAKAFGTSKTTEELSQIADQANGRIFEVAVEFFRIPHLARNPDHNLRMKNSDIIWNELQKKKGALLLVSHLGNWEVMAACGGAQGLPIHAVFKPNSNPLIETYVQRIRGTTGLKTIEKIGAMKDVSNLLKDNQVVCMAIDQRVKGGEKVSFLGQTAPLSSLPALLALRYGTPIIPCFFLREEDLSCCVIVEPPVELVKGDSLKESVKINTQNFAKRIEDEILKIPGEWVLWRHNIWKD